MSSLGFFLPQDLWQLRKDEGAERLRSHCSGDRLREGGRQEGAGNSKFPESSEKKLFSWDTPCLLFEMCISRTVSGNHD